MSKNLMKNAQPQRLQKNIRMMVQIFALPLSFVLSISSVHAFEPFEANYSFNIAGLLHGTASRTLTVKDDIWNYSFKANVASLATASEFSHFRINLAKKDDNSTSQRIESLDHYYNFKFLTNHKTNSFKVDWNKKVVNTTNQNGSNSYPAQVGMLDMLDLELQVREDIKHKRLQPFYLLADDKGISRISFVNEGDEKVTTDAGTYDTVRIRLVQENQKRKTYFWLAPKMDYLPVQVRQDDGSLSYILSLTRYTSDAK
ncbi:MAG: DUF3108 domain-containing protein [Candidatus Saccharibacteria bacterium]|nr:DUF3108 domain-containing protein [Moraxellaceae bacterium]